MDTIWFVMTHYDMKRFMEWLKTENAHRLNEGKAIIEPFYPYDFLKEGGDGDVSEDFANIVFLKKPPRTTSTALSTTSGTPSHESGSDTIWTPTEPTPPSLTR